MYQKQSPRQAPGINPARAQFMNQPDTTPAGQVVPQAGGGFMSGAAGDKMYGTGRPAPRYGKIANKAGYAMRDARQNARMNAMQRRAFGA